MLIWLEVDPAAPASGGRRSLDDFARAFFGVNPGDEGDAHLHVRRRRRDAERDPAVRLGRLSCAGGSSRLRRAAPLAWIEQGGYRLVYTRHADRLVQGAREGAKILDLTYYDRPRRRRSRRRVSSVAWDSPAFDAGADRRLDDRRGQRPAIFDDDLLKQAIAEARGTREPIRLLVKRGDALSTSSPSIIMTGCAIPCSSASVRPVEPRRLARAAAVGAEPMLRPALLACAVSLGACAVIPDPTPRRRRSRPGRSSRTARRRAPPTRSERIERAQPASQRGHRGRSDRARPGAHARPDPPRARAAVRHADPDQGQYRDGRAAADHRRQPRARRQRHQPRRASGGAAARGRRGHRRQGQSVGMGEHPLEQFDLGLERGRRPDPQPPRAQPQSLRLELAAAARRSRPAWCRRRSAPRPTARSPARPRSTASSASSRRSAWSAAPMSCRSATARTRPGR